MTIRKWKTPSVIKINKEGTTKLLILEEPAAAKVLTNILQLLKDRM
jgi:hypothetical protein